MLWVPFTQAFAPADDVGQRANGMRAVTSSGNSSRNVLYLVFDDLRRFALACNLDPGDAGWDRKTVLRALAAHFGRGDQSYVESVCADRAAMPVLRLRVVPVSNAH